MDGYTGARFEDSLAAKSRRYPAPYELDKLWTWVCGSSLGGGFVRGAAAEVAKALGVTTRVFERLMQGRSSFRGGTLRRVMARIDALIEREAKDAGRLSALSWSPEDGTACDAKGRYYARYLAGDEWSYLIGCGEGYSSAMEARHAAAKMHALVNASPEAFGAPASDDARRAAAP
jgi:hypothetical protein